MIYPENFERKIGFSEVRTQIKGRCMSTLGTEWVDTQVQFLTSPAEVREALARAAEYSRFTMEYDEDIEAEFYDVREPLMRIRPERTYMEELNLFNLKRSLSGVLAFVDAFKKTTGGGEEEERDNDYGEVLKDEDTDVHAHSYVYPALGRLAAGVVVFPDVIRRIDAVLNKYGKVKDTASPELLTVRHQIEVTMRSISHSLRSIISEAQHEGYIDRDVAPTLRDGRLVIPVAPSLKRKIRGIVHDESATGKTVFIEPAAVVEANNRIRELKGQEHREVIRILQEVTAVIRPHVPEMMESLRFLAHIDYLRALTLFSEQFDAIVPKVIDGPMIHWHGGIHPLLQLSLRRHGGHMVPLDVALRPGQRILLISGPNAGGKSVCLKTVGILQYMLQCGMPVPVSPDSQCGVFEDIFIDIGDEQSIENDLSTYSSHLLNMKQMMHSAGPRSLLLVDEFGSGTEPQIGGALAEAILDRLVKNSAFGIITTHYQNLKHYAEDCRQVVNGAMLYDRAQMQPLFRLQVGNPGSSFAVEIARKIGIPEEVIAYAVELVGRDYIMSDKYLQDIVRDKMYWENKRRTIRSREKELDDTVSRYEQEMTAFQQERRAVLAKAKAEAQDLLDASNARIEHTIRTIREAQADKEKTREARRDLVEFRNEMATDKDEEDAIARRIAKIQRRQQRKAEGNKKKASVIGNLLQGVAAYQGGVVNMPKKEDPIVEGTWVRIKGQSSVGRVDSVSGRTARVLFGMMYTKVPVVRLEVTEAPKQETTMSQVSTFLSKETRDAMYEKKLHFKPEIDLRGKRTDEALTLVSYFIDDAIQLEQSRVRILHGTGTGALRELVRNYLRTVPGVASYRDEHVQFGGAGITVVELA